MTWLDDLLLQHAELESPRSFWYWSALCAISAVVKDNIYWDKFAYKVYPNIYVMLHADSGLKKGKPIAMAKELVSLCNNTKIITGRSSVQAMLEDMSQSETEKGGIIKNGNAIFYCASEFASSLVQDPIALTIFTDLYDRNYNTGKWRQLLKSGSFELNAPIITMLTGTNEAHNEDFIGKREFQGGFVARTFMIHETERQTVNSLMFPPTHTPDHKKLAEHLKLLLKLNGPFHIADEIRSYIDNWYKGFVQMVGEQQVRDETGTLNRFDDSMLKTAMLINLARNYGLEMQLESVKEAIGQCEKLVGNVRKTTMGKGKDSFAPQKATIIQELIGRDNHMISMTQLHKKYYLHAGKDEWDNIMRQLEAAGIVRIENMGNVVVYRMPDSVVTEWKRHLEGK